MSGFRFRIAPTPSGFLHKGNVFNFLLTAAIAKKSNGNLLLRIDDIDQERYRQEYLNHIFETLNWLGLQWQEGPKHPVDFLSHFSQKFRLQQYQHSINQLTEKNLLYACTCSRKDIDLSFTGNYAGTCRHKNIPLNTPGAALRIHVPEGTTINFTDELIGNQSIPLHQEIGDFIVRKKDGFPSYQITSLCDDLQYNITHIVRGKDLLTSTAAQLFLAEQLNLPAFKTMRFYHHPLVTDESGNKISKSTNSNITQPFNFQENADNLKIEFKAWAENNGITPFI